MARQKYYVLKDGSGWKIRYNDRDFKYATQEAAMSEARKAAIKVHEKGGTSQVLIQGSDGKWQTEWTYGDDPHPPKG